MGFRNFVSDAVKTGTQVNSSPRGRHDQQGIDAVNQAAPSTADNAFDEIENILKGKTTARSARGVSLEDLCSALVPPNTVPDASHASIAVSLTPNDWNDGTNQASPPQVLTVAAYASIASWQTVAQLNTGRTRLLIQNVGTGNLFLVFGKASQYAANITTTYHMKVAPGQTYLDDAWQGRVDMVSDAGTSASVAEFTRAQNVSQ